MNNPRDTRPAARTPRPAPIPANLANPYSQTGVPMGGADAQPFEVLAADMLPPEAQASRAYVMRDGEKNYMNSEVLAEGEQVQYDEPLTRVRSLPDGVVI